MKTENQVMPDISTTKIKKDALLDERRIYRYILMRTWDESKKWVMFIGLNPSTADENIDDATIRVCMYYALRWNYGGIRMANLFALRATDPKVMLKHPYPIGDKCDKYLTSYADLSNCGPIIAAWGKHGKHLNRAQEVMKKLPPLSCLRINSDGSPHYPLYLPSSLTPIPYQTES